MSPRLIACPDDRKIPPRHTSSTFPQSPESPPPSAPSPQKRSTTDPEPPPLPSPHHHESPSFRTLQDETSPSPQTAAPSATRTDHSPPPLPIEFPPPLPFVPPSSAKVAVPIEGQQSLSPLADTPTPQLPSTSVPIADERANPPFFFPSPSTPPPPLLSHPNRPATSPPLPRNSPLVHPPNGNPVTSPPPPLPKPRPPPPNLTFGSPAPLPSPALTNPSPFPISRKSQAPSDPLCPPAEPPRHD